jgi:hypothetical protein
VALWRLRGNIRSSVGYPSRRCRGSANDLFAQADREDETLHPAPWLQRREGPPRKPDEGRIKTGCADSDLENRLRGLAARIQETVCAIERAGLADAPHLRRQLAAYRAHATKLQDRRRPKSAPQASTYGARSI